MKVELGKFLEVMGIPYKDIHLLKKLLHILLIQMKTKEKITND